MKTAEGEGKARDLQGGDWCRGRASIRLKSEHPPTFLRTGESELHIPRIRGAGCDHSEISIQCFGVSARQEIHSESVRAPCPTRYRVQCGCQVVFPIVPITEHDRIAENRSQDSGLTRLKAHLAAASTIGRLVEQRHGIRLVSAVPGRHIHLIRCHGDGSDVSSPRGGDAFEFEAHRRLAERDGRVGGKDDGAVCGVSQDYEWRVVEIHHPVPFGSSHPVLDGAYPIRIRLNGGDRKNHATTHLDGFRSLRIPAESAEKRQEKQSARLDDNSFHEDLGNICIEFSCHSRSKSIDPVKQSLSRFTCCLSSSVTQTTH